MFTKVTVTEKKGFNAMPGDVYEATNGDIGIIKALAGDRLKFCPIKPIAKEDRAICEGDEDRYKPFHGTIIIES